MNVRQRLAQSSISLAAVKTTLIHLRDDGWEDADEHIDDIQIALGCIRAVQDRLRGTTAFDEDAMRVDIDGPLWPSGKEA